MRCLALAQAWIDAGAEVWWLAADLLAVSRDRLVAEGVQVTLQGGEPTKKGMPTRRRNWLAGYTRTG